MAARQRIRLRNGLWVELDLRIPLQRTLFWLDGDLEPQLSWAIREFVPVGGAFVDCGANCGYFGLEARVCRQARVVFIEPHPRLAATIRANLALNGWAADCPVIEAAASDHRSSATLFLGGENDGSHSLLPDWVGAAQDPPGVQVRLGTLAELLEPLPGFARVDFLKVDTEGHDWKVLLGLGDWLNPTRVRFLYTELGRDREPAVQLLTERGYTGFVARGFRSGLEGRRTARRAERGEEVSFFVREDPQAASREVLWCAKDSPAARRLAFLAGKAV